MIFFWLNCKHRSVFEKWLDSLEFVVLELELVAHVHAEGQQGDGDLGDDAGGGVFDLGVVAADVDNSAEHSKPPVSN